MTDITITQRNGAEGFWFDQHWIRIVRDAETSLGEPVELGFIAADLAKALEQREASRVTRLLDPDQKGPHKVGTPQGEQEMSFVTESGFYDVVIRSNKPQGRALRAIVTREILPQIRKTGRYSDELAHQLRPEWRKARLQSKHTRRTYTEVAKDCDACEDLGSLTNTHYRALGIGNSAAEIKERRGYKGYKGIAKDLLTVSELASTEIIELGVVNQCRMKSAKGRDDFQALDSRVTWEMQKLLCQPLDIELPSQRRLDA